MFSKIIALALAVGHCQAGQNWIRGGTTCIGIDSTMPKTAMIGPCTEGSMADVYISQTLMGAALLDNTASYWNAANSPVQMKLVAEKTNPVMSASRAAMNQKGNDGCEFAAAQASLQLGSGDVTVQYAAVINTGSGVCKASTIEVVQPREPTDTAETLTNGICIDSTSPGTTCAEQEFAPGALKFSAGVAFANGFAIGEVSTGVTASFLGYRLKYDFSSFGEGAVLTYNSAVEPANLAYTQVTSFTVTSKDGSKAATVTLDQMYSYGTMTAGVFAKTGMATIATRSFPVTGSLTSIYVDFIFSATWAVQNGYIMYDPKYTTTGGSASSSSHVVASAFTVALLAAVASLV